MIDFAIGDLIVASAAVPWAHYARFQRGAAIRTPDAMFFVDAAAVLGSRAYRPAVPKGQQAQCWAFHRI